MICVLFNPLIISLLVQDNGTKLIYREKNNAYINKGQSAYVEAFLLGLIDLLF